MDFLLFGKYYRREGWSREDGRELGGGQLEKRKWLAVVGDAVLVAVGRVSHGGPGHQVGEGVLCVCVTAGLSKCGEACGGMELSYASMCVVGKDKQALYDGVGVLATGWLQKSTVPVAVDLY